MRIKEVRTFLTSPTQSYVTVKIICEDGVYGVGDATLNGREQGVAAHLREHVTPILMDLDADRIEDVWQHLYRGAYWRGGPVMTAAISGVDMALWDIKAKRAKMPLYQLLGGKTRESVRVYTHTSGQTFDEVLASCHRKMEQGFTALRPTVAIPGCVGTYGVGTGPKNQEIWETEPFLRTIPRLFEFLRGNLPEEIDLLFDVHERLTPNQASRLARDLEPFRLFFLEDALRPEHKESFRLLRQNTIIPLAMGELWGAKWDWLTVITEQLIDYIRMGIPHVGGVTEAKKIAAIAEPFQIKTAFHGAADMSPISHACHTHLNLSIPNFGIQEWTDHNKTVREVFKGGPVCKGDAVTVDDTPGHGVDIDEEAVTRHPYRWAPLPTVRRQDGAVQDW